MRTPESGPRGPQQIETIIISNNDQLQAEERRLLGEGFLPRREVYMADEQNSLPAALEKLHAEGLTTGKEVKIVKSPLKYELWVKGEE